MLTFRSKPVVTALMAGALLVGGLSACGATPTPAVPTIAPAATAAPAQPTTAPAQPTTAPAVDTASVGIGEAVEVGTLTITVTGVEALVPDEFSQPEAGNVFIGVGLEIENNGSEAHIVSTLVQMALSDAAGTSYSEDLIASSTANQNPDGELAPGASVAGVVGFQVPEDAAGLVFTFEDAIEGRADFALGDAPAAPQVSPTTNDEPATTGALEEYVYPSGLFSIELPAGMQESDNSDQSGVNIQWIGQGLVVLVQIVNNDAELSADELGAKIVETVESGFGAAEDFAISEPEPQSDGSVLVAWNATLDLGNGPELLRNYSYIEQRGDKLSVISVGTPDSEFDARWESEIGPLVNSYRIDPSVAIE